ncbi:MAG: Ferredoxin [Candidatus Methanofastidiosum methylothiophilum]|uniref:Ferredoxin n=1 Tax=Candidatus Methanofastidiosum methylothiophilum TaxID=1705564 RepID=A0A150J668_9EURY|nr:MAG: Ferredoxin [Candidatus Methanofastidiosum methylthiophilus]
MKILIAEGCTKCGVCFKECPEVFVPDSDGNATIAEEFQLDSEFEGEISQNMTQCAKSAESACPVNIISIEE